jgi:hypothetical protein
MHVCINMYVWCVVTDTYIHKYIHTYIQLLSIRADELIVRVGERLVQELAVQLENQEAWLAHRAKV